jgi:hypothetical protein
MPAFERDGVAFNYLDEGDPSGRPFVFTPIATLRFWRASCRRHSLPS